MSATLAPDLFSVPAPNWHADARGHSVQFYSEDAILLEGLGRFIGSALGAGDAAIVIATKSHRNGLFERMKLRGAGCCIGYPAGTLHGFRCSRDYQSSW